MTQDSAMKLKEALFKAYGGFADKRIKKLENDDRFIVDGRTSANIGADGHVYGSFCSMFVIVDAKGHGELVMVNMPMSPDVGSWIAHYGETRRAGHHIPVKPGKQARLLELADKIQDITRPGRRYEYPHYKFSVPEVASALRKLHSILDTAWKD